MQLIGMFYALSLVEQISEEVRARHLMNDGSEIIQSRSDALDSALETGTGIGVALIVVLCLVAASLWIGMAYANARGLGWARTTSTVFGLVGVAFGTMSLATNERAVTATLELLLVMIEVAVLVLLWLPSASAYYRRSSTAG
ncbi:hypothetical protein [Gordonia terrae]|uniref:hypothetical protein n=1 Tax=Gordonia terrae TaxID=2055 RepID=UPI003F6BB6C2